ncbi:DNA polymerase IV [candidate division KSB1 bacterium]
MKVNIMRTIIHLDADAFFASVERGFNPLLKDRPVIVGGLPHQRGCVHTATYEARRMGVKTGMPLRQAKELCPDAVFLKGDFRHYHATGEVISEILHSFSPDVESASIDDFYVDLTSVMHLYDSPVEVARSIQELILEKAHITVSLGIASSKLVARIASGVQKPAGITYIPPEMELEFLSVLPARALRGIGHKTERLLRELSISTVGQISGLSKATLMQLLGNAAGGTIWNYSRGIDDRPVEKKTVSKQISRETSFEEDTDDEKLITGTLRYLTERIAAKLRNEKWTARQIKVKVWYADMTAKKQYTTLSRYTNDGTELSERVLAVYGGFPRRRVRIKLVGVTVSDIEHRCRQRTLFDEIERRDMLNSGLDSVRKKFGFTSLSPASTLRLQNYYRMEKHGYILHTPALSQ